MPKRPRSKSPTAPADVIAGSSSSKRYHGLPSSQTSHHVPNISSGESSTNRSIADLFPFQEIFLRILSFLPPNDLAMVQRVNRYWGRMSVDPQLWKRLYLARYPHPHHSRLIYNNSASSPASEIEKEVNVSSPRTPRSLRPIARLPSRAFPPPSPKRSPSFSHGQLTPSSSATPIRTEGTGHATPLSSRVDKGKGRQTVDDDEVGHGIRNDGVDWKLMLRLGTNWSNGNALSQSTIPLPPSPSPSVHSDSAVPPLTLSPTAVSSSRNPSTSEQYVALSPSYIFISSPLSPLIQVHSSTSHGQPLGIIPPPPGWSNPKRPDNVTCIVSDQSVIPIDDGHGETLPARMTVFYQSGGFVVLTISPSIVGKGISWKREFINPPNNRPRSIRRRATTYEAAEGDTVVLATLHWPILISCTRDFNLSVYSLTPSNISGDINQIPRPRHLQTLKSEVSYHPANLTLFPTSPSSTDYDHLDKQSIQEEKNEHNHFKASLTYCTPLYPSSWTIAVQEFSIDNQHETVERGDSFHVGRNDYEDQDQDEIIWPKRIKPLIGVRGKAVGIGSDGRWCILVGERENKIQVFSLPHHHEFEHNLESSSSMLENKRKFKRDICHPITHSQTLISSNSSDITSLAINSGRCVSSNRDGKLLVWELDEHHDHEENVGKTVGYVEVKKGGRRQSVWKGPTGPRPSHDLDLEEEGEEETREWPHPQSISSAARALFLPRPPIGMDLKHAEEVVSQPPIRYLTFDEEKIVGVVKGPHVGVGAGSGTEEEVMKVWSFS